MAKKTKTAAKVKVEVVAPLGCGIGDNDYDYGDVIKVTRNQANGLLALRLVKEL